MQLTKYIILFTVLILTTLVKSSNAETTCTENDLGDQTCVTTTTTTTGVAGVTTENLLSSNFNDGSWTNTNQYFHGDYVLATKGTSSSSSTVSLTDDAGLSKTQINAGFSSTLGADIWFWSGYNNTVTLRQTLTDDNGTVITQYREITATSNNYGTNYTDTITVGSNSQQNYNITASLENIAPGYENAEHIGPDIENPSLIVTTNDTYQTSTTSTETLTYCYDRVPNACTYDNEALENIADFKTDDGKSYDEYINEVVKIEDLTEEFKVVNIDTTIIVEDLDGKLEEFKIEDYAVETFNNFIEANDLTETFETALIEEDLGKEEFFDTMTDSIKEEFGEDFDMGGDDFKEDLTTEGGPSDLTENTVGEETVETENNTTDLKESNDTTTETKVEEESNETISESKDSENVSNESDVDKNTETERTEKTENNEETVDAKTDTDVKTNSGSSIDTRSIEKKVERVIAKVLAKLKKVDQKLQAVQFITTQGIKSGEADISGYINKRIYGNQNLYNNVSFYENLNILEQQQIYNEVNLNTYTSNDPIAVKQRLTVEIESEISRIQAELYALKQKRGS
jgi:hypothetical protein